MNILIADDEGPARKRLRALLDGMRGAPDVPSFDMVGEAADGAAVLALCRAGPVDLVLLDINMPGMDGIDVALALCELPRPPAVVFATAHEEHALAAFEANAIDYLLKPIRAERLKSALAKARRLSEAQRVALGGADGNCLVASYRGGVRRIPLDEVRYLRADNKYVEVGYAAGTALIEDSLVSIESRYPGRFARIHRNALVVPQQARALERDAGGRAFLRLADDDPPLEVSRRHLPAVRRWLKGG